MEISSLQKKFEKWYRDHHNLPYIPFTRIENRYKEWEIQTAWSAYCEGFDVGCEMSDHFHDFIKCALP